jgi:hypothetical protein
LNTATPPEGQNQIDTKLEGQEPEEIHPSIKVGSPAGTLQDKDFPAQE